MIYPIGRHINISKGFLTAPEYAKSLGCGIFQVFLGNPQQIISKERNKDELIKFGEELEKYKMRMVVHSSYTINLAHPIGSNMYKTSVRSLIQDLNASALIGHRCLGVIIHMGKNIETNHITDDEAIDNYVAGLKEALEKTPKETTIILETGASQGTEVGSTIEGLAQIYWLLSDKEQHRIKFCIDTCHIWATGYDISNEDSVDKFFHIFDENIGVNKIACIHFNDSKTDRCSYVDRHDDLGYGHIGVPGLKAVARFAHKHHIPMIMETPLEKINPKTNKKIDTETEIKKVKRWISQMKE